MSRTLRPLWPGFEYLEHQTTGVNWMLEREKPVASEPRGGIVCDEMGLGKTIQMVALMKNGATSLRENNLLVAPVAVLDQWKKTARRAGLTVLVPDTYSMAWVVEGEQKSNLSPRVHVIGYERALRNPSFLVKTEWHRIIYDEAHRISGDKNRGYILARKLKSQRMWLLTGTPVVNQVRDLSVLLELLKVPVLKSNNLDSFRPLVKKFVMARTMDQLRSTIRDAPPPPVYHTLSLPFKTEEEAEFYRGVSGIIVRRWKALEGDGAGAGAALEKLKLFMRLRQLSLHPQVYISAMKSRMKNLYSRPDWTGSSTKFDAIRGLLRESSTSHKWIFFCHFRVEMEMLASALRAESCVELVQLYHGGMSAEEKAEVVEKSHMPVAEGKQEVMLVQLQSGGTGLNLQHFDRVVFTGPWWTQALMEQAVGRAVRIGQRSVVHVFHIQLKEEEALNIDAIMHEKANTKGKLCREVLESAMTAVKAGEVPPPLRLVVADPSAEDEEDEGGDEEGDECASDPE